MVAYSLFQRLTPTIALLAAGALGVFAALAASLLPGAVIESAVLASGIPAFVPAAEPPLGITARICLAVFAGGGVALLAWVALSLLIEFTQPRGETARRPTVRRADAHPDAPPREPLRAVRDLGFDLPEVAEPDPLELADLELPPEPVIAMGAPEPAILPAPRAVRADPPPPPSVQPLPADLDQPLAAFDPGALPETPRTPPQLVPPLRSTSPRPPVFAEGERFETYDLTPAAPKPAPITGPETEATVHSLLDRLERGIARRAQPEDPTPPPAQQPAGLESTLDALRRMAARG
jgi:hypothetical protein